MKKKYIIISVLLIINIGLIIYVFNITNKINVLQNRFKHVEENIGLTMSNNKNDVNENILGIEEQINDLDALKIEQEISDLKNNFNRFENIIFNLPNIDILSGVVKGIEIKEQIIKLQVRQNEILYGEDAIKILIEEKGYSKEDAVARISQSGYYLKDSEDEVSIIEISNDCEVYFIGTVGLVNCTLDDLIDKTNQEIKSNTEDDYTFVLMNGKVIQIYQAYIPN
ncbi:hypothetical protein [Vallitalea guaymasensis]|uniref:hypothetical protein n=1 Tax=Vallitalea guaymasensis TaxID=1185412 RepID=UPI0023554B86|nr:hypothetical protein [Vallitalea guaymasensis]